MGDHDPAPSQSTSPGVTKCPGFHLDGKHEYARNCLGSAAKTEV
jgi:hypothetical protein